MADHDYRPPFRRTALLFAALLFTVLPASGQSKEKSLANSSNGTPPEQAFEEITQVVQVEIPVNIVTRDGEPVRDLTVEDFEVFDNGRKQNILGFEKIDLDTLTEMEAEKRISEMPSVARRHFLLLFDFSFASPASVLKSRRAARDFVLQALHPTDLVGVATISLETGPQLIMTFTPDRSQLARAIDTVGNPQVAGARDPLRFLIEAPTSLDAFDGGGGSENSERGDLRDAMNEAGFENMRIIGRQMERSERSYEAGRVVDWSRTMGDMARALNSIAGRKHVVYFSEGFDSSLMMGERPDGSREQEVDLNDRISNVTRLTMSDGNRLFGSGSLQSSVSDMLEQFRRADCVIQAVDAAGLRANVGEGFGRSQGADALFYLADETGGELFEGTNNLETQLKEVLSRSAVTYVLSIQPDRIEMDGSYHKLKVKLKQGRKMRISHRAGYYAPRPFKGLHPLEKSLLASDAIASAAPRDEIRIDVLAAPFRATEKEAYVPVILEIDGASLLNAHQENELVVEIYAYATTPRGEMRDFFAHTVGYDISNGRDAIASSGIKYYGHVDLGPGEHLLRVLVRNAATGRVGVRTVPLDIAPDMAERKALLPPFFLDDPQRWLLAREKRGEGEEKSIVYPFTMAGEPFMPAARPALQAGEEAALCLVAYNLDLQDPGVRLEGRIVDADGTSLPARGLDLLERTVTGIRGLDKWRASFQPKGLDEGEYTLEVSLSDRAGNSEHSSIPFTVIR